MPTTPAPKGRAKPVAICAGCNKPGGRWHCDSPTNQQCDIVICIPCNRMFPRANPARWVAWRPNQ